ncbi:MAG: tyrosine-type recombinase/integrase [Candidatus Pacearchaeota archaeon]
MKKEYPNYQERTTKERGIEDKLKSGDKKALNDFLKSCLMNSSKERVEGKLKTYILEFYDIIGNLTEWNLDTIRDFLILLNQTDKTEWTKNDIKKIMKRFIRFYYKTHKDFEEMILMLKCKSDAFNYERINENNLVNPEEFEKILRCANTLKQKAILSLLFETGCRPQELRTLKWNDIKIDGNIGNITFFSGKTKKSRTIPVKDCILHLQRHKQEFEYPDVNSNDYIFPSQRNRNEPLSNNALPVMFKRLSKNAGLNKNIFPYLFRHSRLTKINQQMPTSLAIKFAGHSLKQSQTYVHLSSEDLRTAMQKIWKVKELTSEQKNEYEKELENIKNQLANIEKVFEIAFSSKDYPITLNDFMQKMSNKTFALS